MMNNNLGYKYSFPSEISFQRNSSLVESSSSNTAATRLSYITAASRRIPKSSSGVLGKKQFHSSKKSIVAIINLSENKLSDVGVLKYPFLFLISNQKCYATPIKGIIMVSSMFALSKRFQWYELPLEEYLAY
jgi:hypothetical protein